MIDDEFNEKDTICHREEIARDLRGSGIEIGALHKPLKIQKYATVKYLDYKSKIENEQRYPELVDFEIVETHIIDDGFVLNNVELNSLDFIIANHALEHSPDALGTLEKWKS